MTLPEVVAVAERPDIADAMDRLVASNMPAFMLWESPGNWRWHRLYELHPEGQLAYLDDAGDVVGTLHTIPCAWAADGALPGGFDEVVVDGTERATRTAGSTCLLSMSVRRDWRRRGLAEGFIDEARRRAPRVGHGAVIAPVRPTVKAVYPMVDIDHYVRWRRADGRAFDPWIRTHIACGGSIAGTAPASLTVRQPVGRWAALCGRPMERSGMHVVPGALSPVVVDDGYGTYVEPNVWITYDS